MRSAPCSRVLVVAPLLLGLSTVALAGAFTTDASDPVVSPRMHASTSQSEHAHQHDHTSAHAAESTPIAKDGTRWSTDEPLREGMGRLRDAVSALHEPDADRAGADAIDTSVRWMFEHCRLPAEPDQALHGLLARTLKASAELREGADRERALAELESVLADYPRLFDHPGWAVTKDAHTH